MLFRILHFFICTNKMSYFLGFIGKIPQKIKDIFESNINEYTETFYSEKYILSFGEKNERLSYNISSDKAEVLLGIPIYIDLNTAENLNSNTFFELKNFENINGHYTAFEIKDEICHFYTDALGIRSIYVIDARD